MNSELDKQPASSSQDVLGNSDRFPEGNKFIPSFEESKLCLLGGLKQSETERIVNYFINEAIPEYKKAFSDLNNKTSASLIRGFVFEQLSYLYSKDKLEPNQELISPIKTHELFTRIQGNKYHIPKPDGLVLYADENELYIDGIAEFKSGRNLTEQTKVQMARYENGVINDLMRSAMRKGENIEYFQNLFSEDYPETAPFIGHVSLRPYILFVGSPERNYYIDGSSERNYLTLPLSNEDLIACTGNLIYFNRQKNHNYS